VFVKVLLVPRYILVPMVAMISYGAIYAASSSMTDLMLMTGFGLLGYLMRKTDFPLAPVILALVLGPMMETSLRRALSLSNGDWGVLFASPLVLALWGLVAVSALVPMIRTLRRARKYNDSEQH
jgi:putative tricarboxylic transport membrane protein